VNGEIYITDKDLREMFDPCVDRIIDLIAGQIGLVQDTGSRVRYVFLTGGFAQSPYLFDQVHQFTRLRRIQTKRVDNNYGWSAVVRGAVLKGLENQQGDVISMRKCRRHYGISVSQPFSTFQHSEDDAYIDPFDGERKARGQMVWLFKKGDALLSNKEKHASIDMCRRFGLNDNRVYESKFVALEDEDAPQRYADLPSGSARMSTFAVRYDLSEVPQNKFVMSPAGGKGQPYLCAYFKLEIRLETRLEFSMTFDGHKMGTVEVDYE